jgi:hypothetical protein
MTRRERFRDTKTRQIERVHARFATLEKNASAFSFKVKLDAALSNQSGVRFFVGALVPILHFANLFPKPYN